MSDNYEAAQKQAYETGMDVKTKSGVTIKGDPKTRGLHFATEEEKTKLKDVGDEAEKQAKLAGEGEGPLRQKQKAYWDFAKKANDIRVSLQSNEVKFIMLKVKT
jgi:hypothetical protein